MKLKSVLRIQEKDNLIWDIGLLMFSCLDSDKYKKVRFSEERKIHIVKFFLDFSDNKN